MNIGDVFRIKWTAHDSIKHATGLYLGENKSNQLWLLCFICKVDARLEPAGRFLMHGLEHDTEMGFSFLGRGNLLFGDYIEREYQIGKVDESELSEPLITIWESTESWKLQKVMESTGSSFWLNIADPKGKTVVGGMGRL